MTAANGLNDDVKAYKDGSLRLKNIKRSESPFVPEIVKSKAVLKAEEEAKK